MNVWGSLLCRFFVYGNKKWWTGFLSSYLTFSCIIFGLCCTVWIRDDYKPAKAGCLNLGVGLWWWPHRANHSLTFVWRLWSTWRRAHRWARHNVNVKWRGYSTKSTQCNWETHGTELSVNLSYFSIFDLNDESLFLCCSFDNFKSTWTRIKHLLSSQQTCFRHRGAVSPHGTGVEDNLPGLLSCTLGGRRRTAAVKDDEGAFLSSDDPSHLKSLTLIESSPLETFLILPKHIQHTSWDMKINKVHSNLLLSRQLEA